MSFLKELEILKQLDFRDKRLWHYAVFVPKLKVVVVHSLPEKEALEILRKRLCEN